VQLVTYIESCCGDTRRTSFLNLSDIATCPSICGAYRASRLQVTETDMPRLMFELLNEWNVTGYYDSHIRCCPEISTFFDTSVAEMKTGAEAC